VLTRGLPSAQFWTQVLTVLGVLAADCNLGCNPLVAPLAFVRANRNWGTLERWGRLRGAPPTSTVLNLLTLSMPEQRQMCLTHNGLPALTRKSTLDPQSGAALVYVFRRDTRATAAKGSWRKETVGATKTAEAWTLLASSAAVSGPQVLA
jgi:hypothetical protein